MCLTLEKCYDLIDKVINSDIIELHISIDNFLFQDIDISQIKPVLPTWMAYAGISAESEFSKDYYEKLRRQINHPYLNRIIYHYDVWSLVSAVQDRLQAVEYQLRHFYKSIPYEIKHKREEYTACTRVCDTETTLSYATLNSVFVTLASTFDIITKIATEQYFFSEYNFSCYGKMKSDGVLFNRSGNKNINTELKKSGLLFSVPLSVKKVLSYRDEYVHNGPWDMRCSLYLTAIDGMPADVIMLSPDMDENGNFVTSGSRNKFYSQNNIINADLPYLVYDVIEIIGRTVNEMTSLYQKNTSILIDEEKTKDCMKQIKLFYSGIMAKCSDAINADN